MKKKGRPVGYSCSEETKNRISKATSERWELARQNKKPYCDKFSTKMIQTPDGVFQSRKTCAEHYNISPSAVKFRIESERFLGWEWI